MFRVRKTDEKAPSQAKNRQSFGTANNALRETQNYQQHHSSPLLSQQQTMTINTYKI